VEDLMTDEQKAALEWLELFTPGGIDAHPYARTIKAMLAEPRLPEEVDIDCASQTAGLYHNEDHQHVAKDAIHFYHVKLRARLRKPQTKTVDVEGWAVVSPTGYVGVFQRTKADAETWLWRCQDGSTVVRVTGKAEVRDD
jgi:hypothetical protein